MEGATIKKFFISIVFMNLLLCFLLPSITNAEGSTTFNPSLQYPQRSLVLASTVNPPGSEKDPFGSNAGGSLDEIDAKNNDKCDTIFDTTARWLTEKIAAGLVSVFGFINEQLEKGLNIFQDSALYNAWERVRNVALSLITLALIIIALANMLQLDLDKYGLNRVIPKLIIAILLAFFSYLIARVLIETANALQNLLVENMGSANTASFGASSQQLQSEAASGCSLFDSFGGFFLVIIAALIAFGASLWLWVLLLARNVVLFFLVAVAPIAFIMQALPFTSFLFKQWWERFYKWVFMGPAIALFLSLGVIFLRSPINSGHLIASILSSAVSVLIAASMPTILGREVYSAIKEAREKAKNLRPKNLSKKVLEGAREMPFIGQKANELLQRRALRESAKDQRAKLEAQKWQAKMAQKGAVGRLIAGVNSQQAEALSETYYQNLIKEYGLESKDTSILENYIKSGASSPVKKNRDLAAAAARVLAGKGLLSGLIVSPDKTSDQDVTSIRRLIESDMALRNSLFAKDKDVFVAIENRGQSLEVKNPDGSINEDYKKMGLTLAKITKPQDLTEQMIRRLAASDPETLYTKFADAASYDAFMRNATDKAKVALREAGITGPTGQTSTKTLVIPESATAAQHEIENLRNNKK